jgi:hypothetical protein
MKSLASNTTAFVRAKILKNTTEEAFGDAEQEQRSDWEIAVEYYPDLDKICAALKRTSHRLAFAFRATVLESKLFNQRKEIAQKLELTFLQSYFGTNQRIIEFARTLIENGHKTAARELNRAISVFGSDADPDVVIGRISQKHLGAPTVALKVAQTLLQTRYVSDARELIKLLHGTIEWGTTTWRKKAEIHVHVLGEEGWFRTEVEMVQWVIQNVVPKVITGSRRQRASQ